METEEKVSKAIGAITIIAVVGDFSRLAEKMGAINKERGFGAADAIALKQDFISLRNAQAAAAKILGMDEKNDAESLNRSLAADGGGEHGIERFKLLMNLVPGGIEFARARGASRGEQYEMAFRVLSDVLPLTVETIEAMEKNV